MIEVNSVEAVPGFGLLLTFNSGEQRRFDMCPYLHLCTESNYAQLLFLKVQESLFHWATSKALAH